MEVIRNSPEFKAEINAFVKIVTTDGITKIQINKVNNSKILKKSFFDKDFVKGNQKISLEDYINYLKNFYTKIYITINDQVKEFTLKNIGKKDKKIIISVSGPETNIVLKNGKISVKALVPVAENVKEVGPVKYTTKNPFIFPTYRILSLPDSSGPRSLVNKGAIFWYNATQTKVNVILGFKFILVNTSLTSFIPDSAGYVTLNGADFYYGWYNTNPKYPKQYVDFYIYQQPVNNYLYKFTVKVSQFFTNANFPSTKVIGIK